MSTRSALIPGFLISLLLLCPFELAFGQQPVRQITFHSTRGSGRNSEGIGGGQNRYLHNGNWLVYAFDEDGDRLVDSVHVQVFDEEANFWMFEFASGLGSSIVPGTYESAQTYPFADPCFPSLNISGMGRACSQVSGSFTVLDAEFDTDVPPGEPTRVVRFAVRFEQNCGDADYPLRGSVYVDSPVIPTGPAPVVKTVEYSPSRQPYRSTITVTGTKCDESSVLIVDGSTSVIPLLRSNSTGAGGVFHNTRFPKLSPGPHQIQIANVDGAISAPFVLQVR